MIDVGAIPLFSRKRLLKQVVIQGRNAIVVKGDTISFAADSFATKAGDVVEDLLKLLPGIQVDASGAITTQGKKVQKVLVNGEEFFGTDPTIATQNLPSSVVETVEVFDGKTAQEEFTGFSGDADSKVINLKLKKGMSKGAFGKVASAGGWEDRWEQKALVNKFEDKEQISGYYLSSSNGTANASWEEGEQYGIGDQNYSWNPFGGSAPHGITKSWKTGARYTNKMDSTFLGNTKQEFQASYGFTRSSLTKDERSNTENLLPGNTFYKKDSAQSKALSDAHNIRLRYEADLDSQVRIIYNSNVNFNNGENTSYSTSDNRNNAEQPISFNRRNNNNTTKGNTTRNSIDINKKFNKEDRKLAFDLDYNTNNSNSTGKLLSTNGLNLLNGGNYILLDQLKTSDNATRTISSKIVYTEPLSKRWHMKFSYAFRNERNDNRSITSDTSGYGADNYQNQLDSLSNIFENTNRTHTPGIVLRYKTDKWQFDLENEFNFTRLIRRDLLRNNNLDFNQYNYVPRASVRYKLSKYSSIRLSYNGNTRAPSANQLQPFQDNTNPLSVVVGNPNLRISYSQRINLYYNSYAPIEGNNTGLGLNVGNTINQIGTNRFFETSGRTVTTYVNLPNTYSASLWGYTYNKLGNSKFKLGTNADGDYNYTPNIINGVAGYNEGIDVTVKPSLNYFDNDLLSAGLALGVKYNNSTNKGNADRTVAYFSYAPAIDLTFFFPQFITVSTNMSYEYTPAVGPYNTPFSRLIWKPEISKQFLKDKSLIVKIEIFDALNQNRGYTRQNDVNYNTESFYNTLGRYWMIGASWNFFSGPMARKRSGGDEQDKSGQGWVRKKKAIETQ